MLDCSELGEINEKENFEKVLQNYELEIKTHVKVEQEMQIMLQEYQNKYNDTQKSLDNARTFIKKLESDNSNLSKHIDDLEDEL